MKQLAVVAGFVYDKYSFAVLILLMENPLRLAFAARIVTLLALLAMLVVVGVRAGTAVSIGFSVSSTETLRLPPAVE